MDFLRTLLAYMAVTFVVAVESTATPSVTPVPTPAPAVTGPVYTVMGTLEPAATPSPEPTVSVTPVPVPTITANIRGYHNLLLGDRGDEVRKLQERLIELGYLPEGAADGAFGGQTRTAVRRFQYYNGLTVDGIAGRTTQTNLFENPDAAPMPTPEPTEEPTPTPEPTEEPTATPEPGLETTASEAETAVENAAAVLVPDEGPDEDNGENVYEEQKKTAELATAAEQTPEVPEEVTVTPYVVATPTQIPWGDATAAPVTTEEEPEGEEEATGEANAEDTKADKATVIEATQSETEATEPADHKEETETQPVEDSEAVADGKTPGEEIVEEVNLDEPEATATPEPEAEKAVFSDLAGWVILNDGEEALQWTVEEDGNQAVHSPRMQIAEEDDIRVSLDDLAMSIESWVLNEEAGSLILEAQGYTLALLDEENGIVATVDGIEKPAEADDFSFEDGHFIRASFLSRALDGSWEWNAEEETLTLRIPEKTAKTAP